MELKHLATYLPYGLKFYDEVSEKTFDALSFITKPIQDYLNYMGSIDQLLKDEKLKPILRPLSDLTSKIEHNGERFVPIEYFEIGDDDKYPYEFDNGNIKLIQKLKTIKKYSTYFDISFLPFEVVRQLIEWHFDVFGLIEKGEAIDINTL